MPPSSKVAASRQGAPAKQPSPEEQLQQAINNSGNDRAALVRNLEAFLKDNPDSRQRPQIYRALVEASLQLQDNARAAGYAERIVALSPDDISMTILTIQLLEQNGDEAALRRATNYATRVLEFVERSSNMLAPLALLFLMRLYRDQGAAAAAPGDVLWRSETATQAGGQ